MFRLVRGENSPSLKCFALWLLSTSLVDDISDAVRVKVKKIIESAPNDSELEFALKLLKLEVDDPKQDYHRLLFLLADCYWVIWNDQYLKSSNLAIPITNKDEASAKLASIPEDIIYLIFEFLKIEDVLSLSKTTRSLRRTVLQFKNSNPKFEALGTYANYLLRPVQTTIGQHQKIASCATNLSKNNLVSGSADMTLKWWQLKEQAHYECKQTLEGHRAWVTCVCALPDKTIISGSDDGILKRWYLDKDGKYQVETIGKHGTAVYSVICLPSGELVSAGNDGNLRLWRKDKEDKYQTIQELKGHKNTVNCIARLSNGDLVSGSLDGEIKIWRLDKNQVYQEVQTLQDHTQSVEFVCSVSSNRFLSGARSGGKNLKIWKINKDGLYEFQQDLEGHKGPVNCALELPSGEIITGSTDSKMKVWRLDNDDKYQCLRTLKGTNGRVLSLNYLSNGNIVSSFYSGALRKLSFPSVIDTVRAFHKQPEAESSPVCEDRNGLAP